MKTLATALVSAALLAACGGSGPDRSDVAAGGSGPEGAATPGTEVEFRMTVSNAGPDTARDFVVEQTADERLQLLSIACTATGGATCPASPALVTGIASLPAGGVLTFVARLAIPLGVTGGVAHRLQVRELEADTVRDNNSISVPLAVANADLAVTYLAPAAARPGADTTFTATVANLGGGSAPQSTLAWTVPDGTTAGAVECEAFDGAACPADLAARPLVVGPLPTGGRLRLRLAFAVAPEATGTLSSTFSAATASDVETANDSATASTPVDAP